MPNNFSERVQELARNPGSILRGFSTRYGKRKTESARARDPGDQFYFQDMIDRQKQVFQRYTIYRTAPRTTASAVLEDATTKMPDDRETLRIICVGSELNLWDNGELEMDRFPDGVRLLRPTRHYKRDRWIKSRLEELAAAIEENPDVIIFPEFAYPAPSDAEDGAWTWEEIESVVSLRDEFNQKALELIGDRDIFLVLGSFHCLHSFYNIGVVFPWGSHLDGQADFKRAQRETGRRGLKLKDEKSLRDGVRAPVLYRKRFPARLVGEQARVPGGNDFNVFVCPFGRVAFLICSDVLDANQFMNIMLESLRGKHKIDYVFIAAYNPGTSFDWICQDLSNLAANTVVVANAQDPGNPEMPKSEIFICGQPSQTQAEALYEEHRDLVVTTESKAGSALLTIFDLRLPQVNHAREQQINRLAIDDVPTRVLWDDGPAGNA